MKFRTLVITLLLTSAQFFTAQANSASYSKAEDELKAKNQDALQKLATEREKIKNEKIPLATKLSSLERTVAEKRRELDRLQRLRDNKSVSLVTLKKEVDGRKNEAQFLATLGSDYLANFEARLHVSEIESNQEKLNSIKSVLDGTSADKSKMIARMDLLKLSLARIENLLGGMKFEGKALDSKGKVVDGSFILSGPLSYFSNTEGTLSGLTQSGRDLKPRIFTLASEQATQIRNTFSSDRNSTTVLPIDATQGDALKVAAAEDTVIEHVKKGGTWAYPIVFAAGVSVLIALFKYFQLNGISIPRPKAVASIIEKVEQGDQKGAEKLAGSLKGPFKSMFTAGISRMGEGKKMVDEVMYEELLASQPRLESYLSVIQVTAATAPLMGLLGTVTGMIKTFKQITLFGTGDAKSLSEGISEALITTELGLVAAIPSLILYAILSKRSKAILAEMERLSSLFLNSFPKRKDIDKTEEEVAVAN